MTRLTACLLALLALALALLTTSGTTAAREVDPDQWIIDQTVRTKHSVPESRTVTLHQGGTGSIVHRTPTAFYVLTCRHNFTERSGDFARGKIVVVTSDDKEYPASVLAKSDVGRDLAVLVVKTKDVVKVAAVARTEKYAVGTRYVACGFPNWKRVVRRGKALDWYTTNDAGYRSFATSIEAAVGISGAGVYRESDKQLVGVLRGGGEESDGAISVRLSDVREFFDRDVVKAEPALGKAAWLVRK